LYPERTSPTYRSAAALLAICYDHRNNPKKESDVRTTSRCVAVAACLVALLLGALPAQGTLVITDDPANQQDKADFEALLALCEELSPAVHDLMEAIRRSNRTVTVDPGRGQPGVGWDAFDTNEVDLDDMDAAPTPTRDPNTGDFVMPAGFEAQAATSCQILIHFMYERFHSLFVGGDFRSSHGAGNDVEGRVRRDFGQDGDAIDTTGSDGGVTTVYRNDDFYVEDTPLPPGGGPPGPSRVRKVKVICSFRCAGGGDSFPLGADSVADAVAEAGRICGGAGNVGPYFCRSS
jgi:hypothetical protein